jgi:transitional endoplasmic reticulum ATPase
MHLSMQTQEVLKLSPSQQAAAGGVLEGLAAGDVVVLRGDAGLGKTTLLRAVEARLGGALLGMNQFMEKLPWQSGIEETFQQLIGEALLQHDLVIFDDLHLILNVVEGCNYPRMHLLDAAFVALLSDARANGKKILFSVSDDIPPAVRRRAYTWRIASFEAEDYKCICSAYLGSTATDAIDYERIHRFAPALDAHQLKNASLWLQREGRAGTDRFLDYLREQDLVGNVALEEVDNVDWKDLKGVDEVIEALEAKIALPFENDALAREWNLKPKRGVLLAGPPGTGKTTVGRALAHRLKSKFFLIDGTMVAGRWDFYDKIHDVFEAAKRNAPSIIFIDDADVLFESKEEHGLCRYLLTMMDGLESASAERVCVILTAMEPANLPAAVLRSGRVELWLEMRLPDQEARSSILHEKLRKLPPPLGEADWAALASASHGLTGADLKSVFEDGKLLFASDKARGRPMRPVEEYFLDAIAEVRRNRKSYLKRKPSPELLETVKIGFRIE